MNHRLLYYVVPKDNFKAEGRVFLKGEKYPVYDVDGDSLLIAENGDFRFTNQLMNQVIEEWDFEVMGFWSGVNLMSKLTHNAK